MVLSKGGTRKKKITVGAGIGGTLEVDVAGGGMEGNSRTGAKV